MIKNINFVNKTGYQDSIKMPVLLSRTFQLKVQKSEDRFSSHQDAFVHALMRYSTSLKGILKDLECVKPKNALESRQFNKTMETETTSIQNENLKRNEDIQKQRNIYKQKYRQYERKKRKLEIVSISNLNITKPCLHTSDIEIKKQQIKKITKVNNFKIRQIVGQSQKTKPQNTTHSNQIKQKAAADIVYRFITPRVSFLNYNLIVSRSMSKTRQPDAITNINMLILDRIKPKNRHIKYKSAQLSNIFI